MNCCLLQLTSDDYRNFRRAYGKIRYSFFEKDQGDLIAVEIACQFATETSVRYRGEFLNDVENPNRAMYFFMVDGEIQGYAELIFKDKVAEIFEFAVFEHGKGWGSKLYDEIYAIIKKRGCTKINLHCPFKGAQQFWRKKGFVLFVPKNTELFSKKVK